MDATGSTAPTNMLLTQPEYQVTETAWGTWRRFLYPTGMIFAEYRSHTEFGEWPLVHITYGICPETGRRITAKGIIAIGRCAHGFLAIGQLAVGAIAIGQLAIGVVLGLGQACTGTVAVGQAGLAAWFGLGQVIASGHVAIAQVAWGDYVLAQIGWGEHVMDTRGVDAVARDFFRSLVGL